jgi:uncharacterized membrane protein YiaA
MFSARLYSVGLRCVGVSGLEIEQDITGFIILYYIFALFPHVTTSEHFIIIPISFT